MGVTDPTEEYFKDGIWGWDATAEEWVKLPVDSEGRLKTSMSGFALDSLKYVTTEATAHLSQEQVLGTDVIMAGTHANRPAAATAGRLYYETDTNELYRDSGTAWVKISAVGVGFYSAYVCVRDKKTQGTHAGTFTSGAWRTRDINDEQADAGGICSIASNQITLAAGTYRCLISAPCHRVQSNQLRLYNITDSTTLLVGTSTFLQATYGDSGPALLVGRFTLAAQKVLEVQHQCTYTGTTTGLGFAANLTDEIYTVAEFWKEV